jgi:hypothetical protein
MTYGYMPPMDFNSGSPYDQNPHVSHASQTPRRVARDPRC